MVALYVDISGGEFLRLALVGSGLMFAYNLVYAVVARRLLEPVRRWLEGDRDRAATIDAWRACVCFPREMLRREWIAPVPGILSWTGLLFWVAYATRELGFPACATSSRSSS